MGRRRLVFSWLRSSIGQLVALAGVVLYGGFAALRFFVRGIVSVMRENPWPDELTASKEEPSWMRLLSKTPPEPGAMAMGQAPPASPAKPTPSAAELAHPYRTSRPVAPSLFEDKERLEAQTHREFEQWVRTLPMAPWDPSGILRQIAPQMKKVGRLCSTIDTRRLVLKYAAYSGAEPASGKAVDPSTLDPFEESVEIRRRSRYIATCSSCEGKGEVRCPACSGSTRVDCEGCGGEGKVMGLAVDGSRRRLNCKPCKGKGNFVCMGCKRGKVNCPSCMASGKMERWLAVERKEQTVVRVRSEGAELHDFDWTHESRDVPDEVIAKDAKLVSEASRQGPLEAHDLPPGTPQLWRDKPWTELYQPPKPGVRISFQRFQLLELPAVKLTYGFAHKQQQVVFEGMRLTAPPVSSDELFHSRATMLRGVGVLLLAVPVTALVIYASRGAYFMNGATFALMASLLGVAALLFAALQRATLGRPARRWALAALAPALAAVISVVSLEPRISQAQALLNASSLDLAEAELNALGKRDSDELGAAWDELYLQHTLRKKSCHEALAELSNVTASTLRWAKGRAHADALAMAEARALMAKDVSEARRALVCASAEQQNNAEGYALRVQFGSTEAVKCLEARNWECAQLAVDHLLSIEASEEVARHRRSLQEGVQRNIGELQSSVKTEKSVRNRLREERLAIELWTRYLLKPADAEPPGLAELRTAEASDASALVKLEQQEAKEQFEAEKRAAATERKYAAAAERQRVATERAEKQKLAAQERAERQQQSRWNNSPLLCNDGTRSPTCTCGRSSYRGCCSYHGGVDGCSAD